MTLILLDDALAAVAKFCDGLTDRPLANAVQSDITKILQAIPDERSKVRYATPPPTPTGDYKVING